MVNSRDKIDIVRGGKVIDSVTLSKSFPRTAFFVEHRETALTLATGKTKKQAEIDTHRRAARTFFDYAAKRINQIAQLDLPAAEDLTDELLHFLAPSKTEKDAPERASSGKKTEEIRALCDLYAAAETVMNIFGDRLDAINSDWAPEFMEAIEAPLDALALEDPDAATQVFQKCDYFMELLDPEEIYLGQGVFAKRSILKVYDTKEKRVSFVAKMCDE